MGAGSHGRQGLRLPSNVPSRERASAGTGVRRRVRAARGSGAVAPSVFHAHPHPRSSLSPSPPCPPSPPATRPRDSPQFEQQRQGVPRPHLPIPVLAGTLRPGAHQDAHPARRPCPRPLVSHFSSATTTPHASHAPRPRRHPKSCPCPITLVVQDPHGWGLPLSSPRYPRRTDCSAERGHSPAPDERFAFSAHLASP